jgi:two-component system, NarL family, nitrate/nitrite response regulator NarL
MTKTPRVLIADDHAPTRAMIRRAIEQRGFLVTAEVSDAHDAIREARENPPDVALLDVRMPGGGIHAATVIGREHGDVCIVMLTVSAEDNDFFSALSAGASGYLLKGQDPASLAEALRRVLSGEAALDGVLTKRLVREYSTRTRWQAIRERLPGGHHLTEKEWQVLGFLNDGLVTSEIAERMFVAKVTVRTHLAAIVRKLGVADRAEAVQLLRNHLDQVDEGTANGRAIQSAGQTMSTDSAEADREDPRQTLD